MSYNTLKAEMATQLSGLEAALAALQSQKAFALSNNIWGEDGENGVKLAFSVMEGTLETKILMAKACKEDV